MLRYRGLLFSVCRRYSRRGLEVDDLLQETTLALWDLREKLFGIKPPPKQAAWIWRVAQMVSPISKATFLSRSISTAQISPASTGVLILSFPRPSKT